MSSASRTRQWSERARFGPMTCMVASRTRPTRSSPQHPLSAQRQPISRPEASLTAPSGTTLPSVTTLAMWLFLTTTISQRESRLSTNHVSGAKPWSTHQTRSTLLLDLTTTRSTCTRSTRRESTRSTGPSLSSTRQPSRLSTGQRTTSTSAPSIKHTPRSTTTLRRWSKSLKVRPP